MIANNLYKNKIVIPRFIAFLSFLIIQNNNDN